MRLKAAKRKSRGGKGTVKARRPPKKLAAQLSRTSEDRSKAPCEGFSKGSVLFLYKMIKQVELCELMYKQITELGSRHDDKNLALATLVPRNTKADRFYPI